jgi:transcriptional regulator GlxA family with amidase domain
MLSRARNTVPARNSADGRWMWPDSADARAGATGARTRPPLSVGVVLAENFTLSAFSLFIDHLRLAADEGDRSRPIQVRWSIMSHQDVPLRASCGVMLSRTSDLLDPRQLDYVVVVGGLLHAGRQIDATTTSYLHRAAQAGVTLVGLCTGSFILCRAGLMRGRRCCVSWYHYQDFLDAFPDERPIADRLFVVDGDRITCAGGAGTADLATYLIERHLGRAAAQKANQVMLFDRARAGDEAQPHPPVADAVTDPRLRRALLLMEQNLADPLPIAAIAARLSLSPRQLERLFQAELGERPASLYRTLRLRYASWLLATTDRSITDIALDAGFSDCAHFSRQFKELNGYSPSSNRQTGRQPAPPRDGGAGHKEAALRSDQP